MKLRKDIKAFTIVELLVVITILAIISVVAYTNFSGTTDKAKNSKKISDLASIETALQTYNQEKNYFPMPSAVGPKNLFGYDGTKNAQIIDTVTVVKSGDQIASITAASTLGGGKVMDTQAVPVQIGAKGTIDSTVLSKQYLSQELLDPSLKDTKVGTNETFKDYGIGEYVYGVYAKQGNADWSATSQKGSAYNLALTLSDEQKGFVTKIIGNFDDKTGINCPVTLIGPGGATINLVDGDSDTNGSPTDTNAMIPYPIAGF